MSPAAVRLAAQSAPLLMSRYSKAMPKVSSKHQITLPTRVMRAAGVVSGDDVIIEASGQGEIRVRARGGRVRRHAGIADGIYRPGELERLRDEWER